MGRLAIRKVIYSGEKYSFCSPYLEDGIIIMEGLNGHGKSTFMNLIYYGLGGKVNSFNKKDNKQKEKHSEICNDEHNYVELLIEINNKQYVLTRHIGENIIFIVEEDKIPIETFVYRGATDDKIIFSDWILEKLQISVFDIVQGTRTFKINFTDLLRLIYHDQTTEVDKIYKESDNSNFLSDSLEIRKAIFEILLGKSYNAYYSALGEYKISLKELEKKQAAMDSYNEFLNEMTNGDLMNTCSIASLIVENQEKIKKIKNERTIASNEDIRTDEMWAIVDYHKSMLKSKQNELEESNLTKKLITQLIDKILYLIDEAEKDLREIEKIRLVNKELKLFSPNTCPYCLRKVERKKGKCICGKDIDEEQYEKFFYTEEEYLNIVRVKEKSIRSLYQLLDNKKRGLDDIQSHIDDVEQSITESRIHINELTNGITSGYNSAYVRQLDEKEREVYGTILELKKAEKLAQKREALALSIANIKCENERKKRITDHLLDEAMQDMESMKISFEATYSKLMKSADEQCYFAQLGDDYMPHINMSEYRERSASVPKRLMYFLTLLIESLKEDTNYPKFLMIDTPNKEGIDKDNLIKNIGLLSESYNYSNDGEMKYQIILTTGLDAYPKSFEKNVFYSLGEDRFLLEKK